MKLSEILDTDLTSKFLSDSSDRDKAFWKIRDNCGLCTLDMISWAKKQGITLTRVKGHLKIDEVVHDKADFTHEMRDEFLKSGLSWNSATDRKQWIERSKYNEDWHLVPHFWAEDSKGNIYDPAGKLQNPKLTLSTDRYIKN
jgi:hypothetical protein